MLRITVGESSGHRIGLTLEGRLIGPWVEELEAAVRHARPRDADFRLDLSALRFADDRGLRLLHRLRSEGVILERASPFIRELLSSRLEWP